MTTGDQVLAYLAAYELQQTGAQSWRCNSPLRANSNSHSFTLDLDTDGEHGTYYDHVADAGGSLYKLRDLLKIPKSTKPTPVTSTKRKYKNLDDYALAHGVPGHVFRAAGWQDDFWYAQPALSFPTAHGARYRLIDGGKDAYIQAGGYKCCLYRLPEAQAIAQPLVICNGEASTVVAQHYGVPAFCQNMGEKKLTSKNLSDLQAVSTGEILIALDCDDKGHKAAAELTAQLQAAGYTVRAVDLGGGPGFDLADFCRLWQDETFTALKALPDLPVSIPVIPVAPASRYDPLLTDANPTDAGNAECLAALYGDKLKFDSTRGRHAWLAWDGQRWQVDMLGIAQSYALLTTRARYHAAATIAELERRKKLATWCITSESVQRQRAMLEAAQSFPTFRTTVSDYDRHPMLATVPNGTLNLQQLVLRPSVSADYLTMQLGTRYDPGAHCPRWQQFMDEVFHNDADLINYVQRAIGYSLTGDTREQKLFLCHGGGANGKSVFLTTIAALLGDYAAHASFDTFDAGHRSDSSNDLAMLRGCRLVTIIETDDDRRLAEARVKQVTGGDMVTCRFLYGEFFSYRPQFKIWLAMNHKPTIRGTDRGIWRRIALIPFTQNFETQDDKQLGEKLLTELPGILNWTLAGLRAWHQGGLGTAAAVEAATTEYRRESDELGKWLDEATMIDPTWYLVSSDAYTEYADWAKARGERYPMSQKVWGRELGSRGFASIRKNINGRLITVYTGIRMRTVNDP
jgi:putative DNA primase/helicase